jgi:hypothetical protein
MSDNQDDYIIERKKDLLHYEEAFLLYQEEKRLIKLRSDKSGQISHRILRAGD